jgi:tetratricopeptide (TPR) repeat protein
MTASDANFSAQPDLKRLLRALQLCTGFGLYFARCNTVSLRNELVATLKTNLAKPIIELSLQSDNELYIDAQIACLLENAPDNAVVFIYDIEKLVNLENRPIIQELNWRRGFYGRLNHPIVFWLPEFLLTTFFNEAPDFADWYSGIYEFSLSQPEQQNLMNNTWQSVNENFVDQLSLKEKERWIINLHNLLAELDGEQSKTKNQLLNRLGLLYKSLGKYDKALTCYQQNLIVQQTIDDKQGEGETLNNLAIIAHAKGDYDTALGYFIDSLKISQDTSDKLGEGMTLNNISQIYHAKGEYDTALGYLTNSLKIKQDIGDKQGEGATLNNISSIYQVKGEYDTALGYLTESLKIRRDIGDKQGEGETLNNMSSIYQAKGDTNTALGYLTESLKIRRDIGDKKGEGETLNNMSSIYQAKGDTNTALSYLTESLKIKQDIGDSAGLCTTLFNIGAMQWQNNEQDLALAKWRQAYAIAKQIGLARILAHLENLAKQLGGEGLAYWEALSQATAKHSDD